MPGKVALVTRYYPPYIAGAERQAHLLAGLVADALGGCDVVTTRYRKDLAPRGEEGAVRIRRLRVFGHGRRLLSFLGAFLHVLLQRHPHSIVHAHCLSSFCLGAILAGRLRGARTVLKVCTVGERGDIAKVKGGFPRGLLWRLFLRSDSFIALTPSMVSHLMGEGVPERKIALVPNLVPMAREAPDSAGRARARGELALPERPTVLFVGRLSQHKGLDLLMQTWSEVARRHAATLVLVGGGPQQDRIDQWARETCGGGSVRLAGWQPDPEPYYRASDIFLFPSLEESFGTALAEAMGHGLAVVTAPVGLAQDGIPQRTKRARRSRASARGLGAGRRRADPGRAPPRSARTPGPGGRPRRLRARARAEGLSGLVPAVAWPAGRASGQEPPMTPRPPSAFRWRGAIRRLGFERGPFRAEGRVGNGQHPAPGECACVASPASS